MIKDRLPRPILPARPDIVAAYGRAFEIAAEKVRPGLPAIEDGKPFIDAAFSDNIFQWDSCFISFWARYAQGAFEDLPDVMSCLDNFYALQDEDGAIAREYTPDGTASPRKDAEAESEDTTVWQRASAFTNPPLFSWAEWEYYTHTGDDSRLDRVLPHLARYFDWYSKNRSRESGHLWYDQFGSGMDDLPRPEAWGWIDYTCQAALDLQYLSNIALHVDNNEVAVTSAANFLALKELINETMWDEFRRIYSDVDVDQLCFGPFHAGSFWALVSDVATVERGTELAKALDNHRHFAREVRVPALAASEKSYQTDGGYWRGGVWPPIAYMTVRGLSNYKHHRLAHEIALNHVEAVAEVCQHTGTIWEDYQPEKKEQGAKARRDFCGWSALGPISLLIEFVLGIRVNAPLEEVDWRPMLDEEHGIENLKVSDSTIDLKATPSGSGFQVTIQTSGPAYIKIHGPSGSIPVEFNSAGEKTLTIQ